MMTENDYRNCIDFAREEGIAEGEAKGIAAVVKSMKAMNLPMETIIQATGLSQKEVEEL